MDDMDTGSASASGSENRDHDDDDEAPSSPAPITDLVTNSFFVHLFCSLSIETVWPIIGVTVKHLSPYQLTL